MIIINRQLASERITTENPGACFSNDPDAGMAILMRGAGIQYLDQESYDQAKRVGVEAAQGRPVSVGTLVTAWQTEGSPTLADLAEAVERVFGNRSIAVQEKWQ